MFHRVKCVLTGLFILLLLFAFTVPRARLMRGCAELMALADEAETAKDPAPALDRLMALYAEESRVFRLFIDHGAVEAVGAAVAAAQPLREEEALKSALSVLREALEALMRIETLDFDGLC